MTDKPFASFTPRPFEELPDGTGFVRLAESDPHFHSNPHDWLTMYSAKVQNNGFYIRLGQYGFRNGSHGEGVEEFLPKKLVLPGRTIKRRPGKRQLSPYAELLSRIAGYKPQGITLGELSGSVRVSRSPERLAELQERLSWLIKLGSLRLDGELYIVTGDGLERAIVNGFTPSATFSKKRPPGLALG